jgi:ribosomal protein S14
MTAQTAAVIIFALGFALLVAWIAFEYLAALRCETCPRRFAVHRRGAFNLCRVCAALYDYAERDLARERARAVSVRHNKPTVTPAETGQKAAKPGDTRVFRPRGARGAGNPEPPGHVS